MIEKYLCTHTLCLYLPASTWGSKSSPPKWAIHFLYLAAEAQDGYDQL